MRLPNDYGDGGSTLIFGEFVRHLGGRLYTVDIEPRHIANCRKVTRRFARRISYHVGDSIEFLRSLARDHSLNRIDSICCTSIASITRLESSRTTNVSHPSDTVLRSSRRPYPCFPRRRWSSSTTPT